MTSAAEQAVNAILFGVALTILLYAFIPKAANLSVRKKAGMIFAGIASFSIVQWTNGWQGYWVYFHMLLTCLAAVALSKIWSGWSWRIAIQRAVSWFLVTDSIVLLLSHVSRKAIEEDVFRSMPLWRMGLSIVFLTGIILLALKGIRRMYPQSANANGQTLALCLLSTLPFLFVRQITLWLPVNVEDVSAAIVITVVCSALLSLAVSISLERLLYEENEKRRALAQKIEAERQQQQYILRKSNIDAVRQQYHDMKNLLLYLERSPSTQNVHAHLNKILDSIQPFETVLDTGNEAVDILLGEKLEVCRKQSIPCTVMVDGALLSFIDQMDLVTILGNAMDNAIEACGRIPPDRRSIQVRTAASRGFTVLHMHNSCDAQITVHGDIPGTTKQDADNHGFGLGNIRRAAEAYHGEVRCEAQDGEFTLTILFPQQHPV